MKPWQKSNYIPPEEVETAEVTVSMEVEAQPPPVEEEVITEKEEVEEAKEEVEVEEKEEKVEEEFKCPVCGKTFKKKVALINHLRGHKRRGEIDEIVI